MFIDVFEVIVGEFFDEDECLGVVEVSDGCWEVVGEVDLCQFEDVLYVDWLLDEGGGVMSLGGYFFNQWDCLFEVGDMLVCYDFCFVIFEVGSCCIVCVCIECMEDVIVFEVEV